MQIHEITLLEGPALAAFAKGFAQGAGINLPAMPSTANKKPSTAVKSTPAADAAAQVRRTKQAFAAKAVQDEMSGQRPATTPKPAAPVVYQFDRRPLNPASPGDAAIIKTLQAAGVTSATST